MSILLSVYVTTYIYTIIALEIFVATKLMRLVKWFCNMLCTFNKIFGRITYQHSITHKMLKIPKKGQLLYVDKQQSGRLSRIITVWWNMFYTEIYSFQGYCVILFQYVIPRFLHPIVSMSFRIDYYTIYIVCLEKFSKLFV